MKQHELIHKPYPLDGATGTSPSADPKNTDDISSETSDESTTSSSSSTSDDSVQLIGVKRRKRKLDQMDNDKEEVDCVLSPEPKKRELF